MTKHTVALTQARLKELLRYDPLTGHFTRLKRAGRFPVGVQAGCISTDTGYVVICIDGRLYYGHRLAWLYMTGNWPEPQCDHKDGIRHRNVWTNLRKATIPEQRQNQAVRSNSKTGIKGVSRKKNGRYRARITVNGVVHVLGQGFSTAEEASAAYLAAKARLHTFHPTVRGLEG